MAIIKDGKLYCAKGTFCITDMKGTCPEDCDCGHWNHYGANMTHGVGCGAECCKSGGTLYALDEDGNEMFCTECNEVEKFDWD